MIIWYTFVAESCLRGYCTINFLQFSDDFIYLWTERGVLPPTPLDKIPHTIHHMSSVCWSFWPLTCQYSSTCTDTVIVKKVRDACVDLIHSIVQRQAFRSICERLLKGYLKGNAGEGKYVTFCRPLELLGIVNEFRSHPSWGAHSGSRIGRRHVSKVSKSEVSNFCFPVAANKYVLLHKHNCQSPRI